MFNILLGIVLLSTTLLAGTAHNAMNGRHNLVLVRDLNQRAPFSSPDPSQWFFADPRSCAQFIACNNGVCTVLLCVGGRHYNPDIQWCDYKENAKCAIGNVSSEDSDESIADTDCPANGQYSYPYPGTCSKYIECYDGRYIVQHCAEGFLFNPIVGFCDHAENSMCEESTTTTTTTTTTSTTTTTTTEATTTATTTEATTTASTTEDPNANGGPMGKCPAVNGQYVDFLTDSKYCSVYYMCNWGTPIKMNCGSGLHFNPNLKVCDWPSNAGCTVK